MTQVIAGTVKCYSFFFALDGFLFDPALVSRLLDRSSLFPLGNYVNQ